jgi:dehydrogenase/reductase SDR family protein 7
MSSDIVARATAVAAAGTKWLSAQPAASLVGYAVGIFALWLLLRLVTMLRSDCDFATAAAARALKPDAFAGQVVWITGASSGIGEALAYEFARQGARLILSARRVEKLMQVEARCYELGCPQAEVLRLDMEAMDSHKAVTAHVISRWGRIDVLANNAGRSQRALAESTELAVDRGLFELNVMGVLSLTHAVLPHMLAARSGLIMNTSSVAGKLGSPISATYSASKHAIQGYFDALRMEVADRGVWVTNVCPGPVKSEITVHAFTEQAGRKWGQVTEDKTKRVSAERCAHLMVAGAAARLYEVWIAPQPILAFTYLGQYAPALTAWLGTRIVGPRRVAGLRNGNAGYDSIQSVGGLLRGFFSGKKPAAAAPAAAAVEKAAPVSGSDRSTEAAGTPRSGRGHSPGASSRKRK